MPVSSEPRELLPPLPLPPLPLPLPPPLPLVRPLPRGLREGAGGLSTYRCSLKVGRELVAQKSAHSDL